MEDAHLVNIGKFAFISVAHFKPHAMQGTIGNRGAIHVKDGASVGYRARLGVNVEVNECAEIGFCTHVKGDNSWEHRNVVADRKAVLGDVTMKTSQARIDAHHQALLKQHCRAHSLL